MSTRPVEIHWIQRALEALGETSRAIGGTVEETAFLGCLCRNAIAVGDYVYAWVGLSDPKTGRILDAAAQAGNGSSFLEEVGLGTAANDLRLGPTATAVSTGRRCVVQDIRADGRRGDWRDLALRNGFGAAAAFPLCDEGRVIGVLSIYSPGTQTFDDKIIRLLEEFARDASFNVRTLRERAWLEKDEAEGEDSEPAGDGGRPKRREGIFLTGERGLSYVNFAFEVITGYAASEVCGTGFDLAALILAPESPNASGADAGPSDAIPEPLRPLLLPEFRLKMRSGSLKHIENHAVVLPGPQHRILGMIRDISDRKQYERDHGRLAERQIQTLAAFAQNIGWTVETRDPLAAGHQLRVSGLAQAIARELGLARDQTKGLLVASLIHDIGMIVVPEDVLAKSGRLTTDEREIIRTHPARGYELLRSVSFPWPVAEIVLQHHECLDGSGYPAGLSADRILMEAKILRLADVVEAMSSPRSYHAPLPTDLVLAEVKNRSGVYYDDQVVEACHTLFKEKGFRFPEPDGRVNLS